MRFYYKMHGIKDKLYEKSQILYLSRVTQGTFHFDVNAMSKTVNMNPQ